VRARPGEAGGGWPPGVPRALAGGPDRAVRGAGQYLHDAGPADLGKPNVC